MPQSSIVAFVKHLRLTKQDIICSFGGKKWLISYNIREFKNGLLIDVRIYFLTFNQILTMPIF